MAKLDSIICYYHGRIHRLLHKFRDKWSVDRHADSLAHNLRV